MIGVSSFACAAIHLLSQNVEADDQFDPCIKVWVQEPMDEFEVSTRVSVRSIKVWVQEPMDEFEVSSCVCTQHQSVGARADGEYEVSSCVYTQHQSVGAKANGRV